MMKLLCLNSPKIRRYSILLFNRIISNQFIGSVAVSILNP